MKRILLVLTVIFLLPVPAAEASRDLLRQQSSRTVDAAGLRGVRVENSRGDVTVSASPDASVHITALKVVRSGSRTESERMARDLRVETDMEAGELVIRVRYPAQRSIRIGFWDLFNDFQLPGAEVRIGLEIPAGPSLTVRSSSGGIATDGVAGEQRLDSTSGDVRVTAAAGLVVINTTSGDVGARDVGRIRMRSVSGDAALAKVRGPLDAHTTSGDLTIEDAADSLTLGTVSGDMAVKGAARGMRASTTSGEVLVERAAGRVDIASSSGDINAKLVAPLSAVSIATGSGDIELVLGRALGARLELQTSNGSLQAESPIEVISLTRRRLVGRLHQGDTPVALRSASGDIHVTTGE